MQKLLTGLAVAAAFGLMASAGQACEFHSAHVTAGVSTPEEGVAMSTHDGTTEPTLIDEIAETAAATDCPDGATDCAPADE